MEKVIITVESSNTISIQLDSLLGFKAITRINGCSSVTENLLEESAPVLNKVGVENITTKKNMMHEFNKVGSVNGKQADSDKLLEQAATVLNKVGEVA